MGHRSLTAAMLAAACVSTSSLIGRTDVSAAAEKLVDCPGSTRRICASRCLSQRHQLAAQCPQVESQDCKVGISGCMLRVNTQDVPAKIRLDLDLKSVIQHRRVPKYLALVGNNLLPAITLPAVCCSFCQLLACLI